MTKRTVVPLSLYLVGYFILVGFAGWGFYFARQQRDDLRTEVIARQKFDAQRAFDICEANNDQLAGIRGAFNRTTDALIRASGPPKDAEGRRKLALYETYIKDALAPLRDRECSPNIKVPVDTVPVP